VRLKLRPNIQAFLLIEATLTVLLVAVGLTVISQAVASNLKALSRIQEINLLLRLAESMLNELETVVQHGHPVSQCTGTFDHPNNSYQWTLSSGPIRLQAGATPLDDVRSVTLTISRINASAPAVRLNTIWPSEWIAE